MKKIIALVAATVLFAVFSIVNVSGGKLPSVGYVLVGPKKRWWLVNETLSWIQILRKTWL